MDKKIRDFSKISPSAKSLLKLKGNTNIPFSRQAMRLLNLRHENTTKNTEEDLAYRMRVLHFEYRYWGIDSLVAGLPVNNILELSSGFSFRGLDMIQQKKIYYIDTDLPEIITEKQNIVNILKSESKNPEGTLELLPLNVLDELRFQEIIGHFPKGPIIILNEGLFMYLDINEKEKLCRIIHEHLTAFGGYWVNADIYIKKPIQDNMLHFDERTRDFYELHRIEENKFESFKKAQGFFREMGFIIDKEANVERSKLRSLNNLPLNIPLNPLKSLKNPTKFHTVWRLKVIN